MEQKQNQVVQSNVVQVRIFPIPIDEREPDTPPDYKELRKCLVGYITEEG